MHEKRKFHSTWFLSFLLSILFIAQIAVGVAFVMLAALVHWPLTSGVARGFEPSSDQIATADQWTLWLYQASGALAVITWVLFMFWTWRAARNARALNADGLRYSWFGAGLWFLVPFANLVVPMRVITELWRASDVGTANVGQAWQDAPSTPLISAWWTTFIIGTGILVGVTHAPSIPLGWIQIQWPWIMAFGGLLWATAAVFGIAVVRGIHDRQVTRNRSMQPRHANTVETDPPVDAVIPAAPVEQLDSDPFAIQTDDDTPSPPLATDVSHGPLKQPKPQPLFRPAPLVNGPLQVQRPKPLATQPQSPSVPTPDNDTPDPQPDALPTAESDSPEISDQPLTSNFDKLLARARTENPTKTPQSPPTKIPETPVSQRPPANTPSLDTPDHNPKPNPPSDTAPLDADSHPTSDTDDQSTDAPPAGFAKSTGPLQTHPFKPTPKSDAPDRRAG